VVHRRLSDVRAVVFDLDGTLVDSLEDLAAALDLALDEHGLARPTRAEVRTWIGGGARVLIAHAVESSPPASLPRALAKPGLVDSVLARFRVHYAAAPVVHTRLYDGLDGVLDRLAAKGTRLAVLSNKPHALAVEIGEVVLARWPFSAIVGHREHVPLKPAPDAALAIAAELGVEPAACAFVGDSGIDIQTAHAAGMLAVGVSWGFRPRAELVAAQPVLVADAPAALAALVDPPVT